jgi:hypothetical protein
MLPYSDEVSVIPPNLSPIGFPAGGTAIKVLVKKLNSIGTFSPINKIRFW